MSNSTADLASNEAPPWSLYSYHPSLGAPIFFAIAVSIIGLYQAFTSFFQTRWHKFGFMMTWGSTVFAAGFIMRAISVQHTQNINLYIAQFVLVIAGPPILAGAEYFVLGRLFAYLPYHAPLNPHRVLSTFIILGAAVESLTGSGAANSAGTHRTPSQRNAGLSCLKAALILQAIIEVCFLALLGVLIYRCKKHQYSSGRSGLPSNVARVSLVLAITSVMMLARCIYRAVEGFLATACPIDKPNCASVEHTEVYLWVFEAANILVFLFLLALPYFNPGKNLPGNTSIFLDVDDGATHRVGPDWKDPRPWFITVIDPFGIGFLIDSMRGKEQPVDRYWLKGSEYPVDGSALAESTGSHLPVHMREKS